MFRKSVFSRQISRLALALAVLMLAGCAAAPPKPEVRYLFPALPNEPHIEFLNIYYSQDNLPKTEAQKTTEALLGKPPLDFFTFPNSIASDGRGKAYISDPLASSIVSFDFVANKRDELLKGDNAGTVIKPHGLAVDSQGRLFVVDNESKKVVVFSSRGEPLFSFGGADYFKLPSFLALNERLGRVYVSDSLAAQIVVFDLTGKHLFSFGKKGGGAGELFGPTGIAIAADNRVFVAEQLSARIQYFDADGNHLGGFGERGTQDYNLEGPRGLAFDSDQNLHVLDARQARWKIFRPDGTLLLALGALGKSTHPLGFTFPNAIWISPDDRIYIVDSFNKCFTVWWYLSESYLASDPFGVRRNTVK